MPKEQLCFCRHDFGLVSLVKTDGDLEDDEVIDIEFVGIPSLAGKEFRNHGMVWECSKEEAVLAMAENDEMIAKCREAGRCQ